MLTPTGRPNSKFVVPHDADERLRDTPWLSYSLTACVFALLELSSTSEACPYFEEGTPLRWFERLDTWLAPRAMQVIPREAGSVRGWNIRIVYNHSQHWTYQGEPKLRCDAGLFYGEEVQLDPFPSEGQRVAADTCLVIAPYDPAPFRITYN